MPVPLIVVRAAFALLKKGQSIKAARAQGKLSYGTLGTSRVVGAAMRKATKEALDKEAKRFVQNASKIGFFAKTTPGEVLRRAYFHEFGTATVPQRSFLRSTLKKNERRYAAMISKLSKRVGSGKMTVAQALNWLGSEVASDVQSTIQRNIRPRLKPATVAAKKRKGYARPNIALFATGEMFDALAYKLVKHTGGR